MQHRHKFWQRLRDMRATATRVVIAGAACSACSDSEPVATAAPDSSSVESAPPPVPPIPPLVWAPCSDPERQAECAIASVPLDYDEPLGARTNIQLVRVPGRGATASLFFNPGGPGVSGVGSVLEYGRGDSQIFGGRFDIIGFDPRGVGASDPLRCFANEAERDGIAAQQPVFPYRSDQEQPYFDFVSDISERCEDPDIRAHMSTADVARDLDLLRQAVGDERLNYLGFSYGTYIGLTYANLFPQNVGAFVLDGVIEPATYTDGGADAPSARATLAELDEFARLCDEAGAACALSGGARARFDAIASALHATPLALEGEKHFGYDALIDTTALAFYEPELDWAGPEGLAALLAALEDSLRGTPDAPARALAILRSLEARWKPSAPFSGYDNSEEAWYGNTCADVEHPADFDAYVDKARSEDPASLFYPWWWWFMAGCARWPLAEDRYTGPWTAQTAEPILVVGNYFDGFTDYGSAVAVAGQLPNAHLLSYAGWGHTAYGKSGCARDRIAIFLLLGRLPPEDACPANANPFLASTPKAQLGRPLRLGIGALSAR